MSTTAPRLSPVILVPGPNDCSRKKLPNPLTASEKLSTIWPRRTIYSSPSFFGLKLGSRAWRRGAEVQWIFLPHSSDFNNARLADGLHCAEFTQHFWRNFVVHVDDAHGLRRILQAAEGKICDIDVVLPEQRADTADDSRDVLIAEQEQETLERRFDVD